MSRFRLTLSIFVFTLFSTLSIAQTSSTVPIRYRHTEPTPNQIYGNVNLSAPLSSLRQGPPSSIDASYFVGPVVQPTSTTYEAESHIAMHILNPSFLLAAISDFSIPRFGFHTNTSKYAWSSDGGSTWAESFMELDQSSDQAPITGDGSRWQAMSDPVVAIDSINNIAYISNLYFDIFDNKNGLYVGASPIQNGSVKFAAAATRPVAVNTDPQTGLFEDKEWIAVDNSGKRKTSGNVYVAWVHYLDAAHQPFGGEIRVASSKDHAANFLPSVVVSPAAQVNAVQGPQIAVDHAGRVVVSWTYCLNYVVSQSQFNASCTQSQVWGAVSSDGGATFASPIPISPVINDLDGSGFPSHYRKWSAPAMAVAPVGGEIAVVYIDQPGPTSVVEYVLCPAALEGACAAPRTISDTNVGQRVLPAVAIDSLGFVHASWFDSRNAPSNPYSSQLDLYAASATSPNKRFRSNVRVTTSTTDFDNSLKPKFIGDYTGIAAGWGIAHPAWTNGYMQTSTLVVSSAEKK